MKKLIKPLVLSSISIILFCCTPYFISNNFDIKTANHKEVAILPFEMIYNDLIPEGLTEEDLMLIKEAESIAFMTSFFNEILRSTKSGKKAIRVNVQHYKNTLQIINENGINISDSWDMKAQDLSEILQVDAVLRGYIEKNQLMPDLESFGIDVGIHIINILTDNALWPWIPFDLTKSKEVKTNYSLVDGKDGTTLWSIAYDIDADWRNPANEIIDDVNRRSSRKFPYRIK